MKLGIDVLLADPKLKARLKGKRVALLAHPASMTGGFQHAIDALMAQPDIRLTSAFGPQHGLRGDKQDNMVESDDFTDPAHGIPIFSLYGKARLAADLILPRKSTNGDESLASFVRRRLGEEALTRMAQPMVGGIYTANPETLSLRATLPRFLDLEQQHRSIILGMWRKGRTAKAVAGVSGARYSLSGSTRRRHCR